MTFSKNLENIASLKQKFKNYEEKYTTLDYLQIDQRSGEALFYKAGANTTYVFHDNGVSVVFEYKTVPLYPSQYNAPPERLAVLFINKLY